MKGAKRNGRKESAYPKRIYQYYENKRTKGTGTVKFKGLLSGIQNWSQSNDKLKAASKMA